MNATLANQVARHLQVTADAIARIEEWANCLFAVVRGMGARFVSKKIMGTISDTKTPINYGDLANKITDEINTRYHNEWRREVSGYFSAKTWTGKPGEARVYCGKYGFIRVSNDGVSTGFLKSYAQPLADSVVAELLEKFEISAEVKPSTAGKRKAWFNEEGHEVDAFDPDAVYSDMV